MQAHPKDYRSVRPVCTYRHKPTFSYCWGHACACLGDWEPEKTNGKRGLINCEQDVMLHSACLHEYKYMEDNDRHVVPAIEKSDLNHIFSRKHPRSR